jgi:DNA-binding IclR family transcriptional regulator
VCIAELSSPHPIRLATTVGGVQALHAGAASKALVAWLPESQREELLSGVLERLTPLTITDRSVFDRELFEVRQRGYAISQGESVTGASAVSAPIFGMDGSVVAVFNVTGPIDRFDRTAIHSIVPALLEATNMISEQLGYLAREEGSSPVFGPT